MISKYINQKLIELQDKINKQILIVGDFSSKNKIQNI